MKYQQICIIKQGIHEPSALPNAVIKNAK